MQKTSIKIKPISLLSIRHSAAAHCRFQLTLDFPPFLWNSAVIIACCQVKDPHWSGRNHAHQQRECSAWLGYLLMSWFSSLQCPAFPRHLYRERSSLKAVLMGSWRRNALQFLGPNFFLLDGQHCEADFLYLLSMWSARPSRGHLMSWSVPKTNKC